jgi:xanthine dehydrogenase small subunit
MSEGGGSQSRYRVRFLLDDELVELDDIDPNRTVLQFLREDLGRTGTKEGCAEGDCGACTVVVADLDLTGKRVRARAVNSCIQLLPTLDGKELLTVESLDRDGLHPVQKALVDYHGSQCGFCTPGFVMSLFALYKGNADPGRRDIDDALAGNLCRCTGYQPIIKAAKAMYGEAPENGGWLHMPAGGGSDEDERVRRLKSVASDQSLCVEWGSRRFFAPRSVDEMADLLELHPEAILLAGGTDVGLWVTKQHRDLEVVVYTGNVEGLLDAGLTDQYIDIGGAVTLTDAMPLIIGQYKALEELFVRFASPPIRNVGTLAGNIANGSPIGDSMPVLMALGAKLVLRRGAHQRTIALHDFYIAYQQTALRSAEFIERILIPLPNENEHVQSYKVSKRFDQDISAVCAAFRLRLEGGIVAEFCAAYGGMAEIPKRARHCEEALLGKEWNEAGVNAALDALGSDFTPISDMRSSSEYRSQVCRNLLRRFFLETTGASSERVYSYGR